MNNKNYCPEIISEEIHNDQNSEIPKDAFIKTKNNVRFSGKVKDTIKNITVEPSMLVYTITNIILIFTTQNLGLEKACRLSLNYSDDICTALKLRQLGDQNIYEEQTQKTLAEILTWRSYLMSSIPAALSLFVGAWSDKTGRRNIFLITVVLGQAVASINNILHTYFFHDLSLEFLIVSEAVIESLSGTMPIFLLVSLAYISAITNTDSRTFRMGLLTVGCSAGVIVGTGICGIVMTTLGYYGSYGLALLLSMMNACYLICFVQDIKTDTQKQKRQTTNLWQFFKDFINLSVFKDIMKVVFKKGPNKRRRRVCVLLSISNLLYGPFYGELCFLYLYTRYKFSWSELEFSMFQTYNTVIHVAGTMLAISLFSKVWRWDDSMLGITATLSKIAGAFVYSFAPTGKYLYVAPIMELLNGTSFLAMRSMISKLVSKNELGKANSVISLMETLTPLVYVPLYTKVYTSTLSVLPGSIYLMGACLTVPAVAVFSWFFYEHRKSLRKSILRKEVETPLTELK